MAHIDNLISKLNNFPDEIDKLIEVTNNINTINRIADLQCVLDQFTYDSYKLIIIQSASITLQNKDILILSKYITDDVVNKDFIEHYYEIKQSMIDKIINLFNVCDCINEITLIENLHKLTNDMDKLEYIQKYYVTVDTKNMGNLIAMFESEYSRFKFIKKIHACNQIFKKDILTILPLFDCEQYSLIKYFKNIFDYKDLSEILININKGHMNIIKIFESSKMKSDLDFGISLIPQLNETVGIQIIRFYKNKFMTTTQILKLLEAINLANDPNVDSDKYKLGSLDTIGTSI